MFVVSKAMGKTALGRMSLIKFMFWCNFSSKLEILAKRTPLTQKLNKKQWNIIIFSIWSIPWFCSGKYVLWIQVGDGHDDHKYWGRPEQYNKSRPCFAINKEKPGSDVAGEISAAFSASAIVFKEVNPKYSAILLDHAKLLYNFANSYRGKYTDFILQAKEFYPSWSGYKDELVWAAIWLYKATKVHRYLEDAELHWTKLSKNEICQRNILG